MEVLDNLPHDKVAWLPKEGGPADDYALHEAYIRCVG
jgi:hypothetical protein